MIDSILRGEKNEVEFPNKNLMFLMSNDKKPPTNMLLKSKNIVKDVPKSMSKGLLFTSDTIKCQMYNKDILKDVVQKKILKKHKAHRSTASLPNIAPSQEEDPYEIDLNKVRDKQIQVERARFEITEITENFLQNWKCMNQGIKAKGIAYLTGFAGQIANKKHQIDKGELEPSIQNTFEKTDQEAKEIRAKFRKELLIEEMLLESLAETTADIEHTETMLSYLRTERHGINQELESVEKRFVRNG